MHHRASLPSIALVILAHLGSARPPSENNPLGKRLVVETRHITEKAFTFSLVVDEKPAKAWIDPYVLRVDRDLDNNDEEVVEAN